MSLRYMSRTCMRALQQLGDQASRPLAASGPIKTVRRTSDNPAGAAATRARRVPSGQHPEAVLAAAAEDALSARRKRREAEKAENVMHLVCWGPN